VSRFVTVPLAAALALAVTTAAAAPAELRVGSKRFAESLLLGEIATQTIAAVPGESARHEAALGGTAVTMTALENDSIDLYPEYLGTMKDALLHDPAAPDDELAATLAAKGLAMTASLGFEDGYALAVRRAEASSRGLTRLSDLAHHPELRIGVSPEFLGRADGWPGLARAYGLEAFKPAAFEHALAYRAIAGGSLDVTDAYTTDAAMETYDLVPLADDRHFFPSYAAVFVYRVHARDEHPRAFAALDALAGKLDTATVVRLNRAIETDGKTAAAVARTWLHPDDRAADVAAPSFLAGTLEVIRTDGPQHLFLVLVSLLAATLVGVPLGIIARRRRVLGALLLGSAGLVQTVPSLALLCFMIPLFGIGTGPALAALFLYGLLPIARNTLTGLSSIPPELAESAEALGLPPRVVLVRVTLPMASPTILAGVKTSAILAVGTATLAAFVGAGGFGVPISTGLGLNDTRLVLEGALPAALLALVAQGLFVLLERVVVPRGLR
jgi:osmoprotectant transport system permease protein